MEKMRQEIAEKDRESEKRELDRHQLTQQCTKLLQMIEEKVKYNWKFYYLKKLKYL
jgi:hypothetical protein